MLVVGPKEAEGGLVNVRFRGSQTTQTVGVDAFVAAAAAKIADKTEVLTFE